MCKLFSTFFICTIIILFSPATFAKFSIEGQISHLNHQQFELISPSKYLTITTQDCHYILTTPEQAHLEITDEEALIKGYLYFKNDRCPVTLIRAKNKGLVHQNDLFTREFTTSRADLYPAAQAQKPSAALLLTNSNKAKVKNKLACQSFVKLINNDQYRDTEIAQYTVVTRLIMKQHLSNQVNDCDYILENYDYEKAEKELTSTHPDLDRLVGPILVVYLPDQTKFSYLIDLSQFTNQELIQLMQNWADLINQSAMIQPQATTKNDTLIEQDTVITPLPFDQIPFFNTLFSKIKVFTNIVSCASVGTTYIISKTLGDSFKSICKITQSNV
ncbi:hypothetical protein [Acinetobacter sp. P1(2025)]|uniref:hypothetical protein n=1 Tax=Acinetobacter sp. P1(2025) TaxID=3446120 RepID=UPI003F533F34